MRVTTDHLAVLREHATVADTPERRARYLAGNFPRADKVQDLNKRYRWDLYWVLPDVVHNALKGNDYNDAHIDTALRAAVPNLQEKS